MKLFARPAVGQLSVVVCLIGVEGARFSFRFRLRLAGVGGEPQSVIVDVALP